MGCITLILSLNVFQVGPLKCQRLQCRTPYLFQTWSGNAMHIELNLEVLIISKKYLKQVVAHSIHLCTGVWIAVSGHTCKWIHLYALTQQKTWLLNPNWLHPSPTAFSVIISKNAPCWENRVAWKLGMRVLEIISPYYWFLWTASSRW